MKQHLIFSWISMVLLAISGSMLKTDFTGALLFMGLSFWAILMGILVK